MKELDARRRKSDATCPKRVESDRLSHFIALFAGEYMLEKAGDPAVISWKLFNDLYENQYDLFRKLRFIIKAGKVNNSEAMALEMIEDYLQSKEGELKNLRQAGMEEWIRRGRPTGLQRVSTSGVPANDGAKGPDRSLVPMAPGDRGSRWSRLLSRIKGE